MNLAAGPAGSTRAGFEHEAFVYRGEDEFVAGTVAFVKAGLAMDAPVLVAVVAPKIRLLHAALGADADRVRFADMTALGQNPARIIPAWREFLDTHLKPGRPVVGVGEPIWDGRRPVEVVEAQLHEALLNVAFDGGPAWRLLCPYDAAALPAAVLDAAHASHPRVVAAGARSDSPNYGGHQRARHALNAPLPEPDPGADLLIFGADAMSDVRRRVAGYARRAGLDTDRTERLALAAHELGTNSVRHGGGVGTLRIWQEAEALVVEVRDHGHIPHLLVGREMPDLAQEGGRGVWLVNQLCDLVQLRSAPDRGTTVRVYSWLN